jgi:hypothetical protein
MNVQSKNILPILIALFLIGTIVYAAATQFAFNNNGSVVVNLEVTGYTDASSTTVVELVEWGPINVGDSATELIYINSTSNVPVTLSLLTADWLPVGADTYITVTWDLEGVVINPAEILEATVTLTVEPDAEGGDFSFTTVINAEEV